MHLHFYFLAISLPTKKSCILIRRFFIFLCLHNAIISVTLRSDLSQDRKSNSYSIESEEFQWALRSVLVIYWRKQEMDLLLDRSNVVNHLNSVSGWRKRLWRASPATNKSNRGEDK